MKLLNYCYEKEQELRGIYTPEMSCDEFDSFVKACDREIYEALNMRRGKRMTLPEDAEDVVEAWGLKDIYALFDIDYYEGGIFYYYLERTDLV